MTAIEDLEKKIAELKEENNYLRSLLDNAGLPYDTDAAPERRSDVGSIDLNQCSMVIHTEITRELARKFFKYFWGRMDVFSKRYQNKNTGKAGYFPQCNNFWRKGVCPKTYGKKISCKVCDYREWTELQAYHVEAHLKGGKEDASDVIGVYPLFPDGTCRFLVFDFDNHEKGSEKDDYANHDNSWRDEVDALREICRLDDIPALTERSRSGMGAHIWIFFDSPVEASLARQFGYALLDKGAESVNMRSFKFYDRMLPAQDRIKDGDVGNLIALPLQGMALRSGNTAFIDENWNAYPDQWSALLSTRRLSKEQIEKYISEWVFEKNEMMGIFFELPIDDEKPWERTNKFHEEDVSGKLQIVLSDQIYIQASNLKPRIQNQIRRLAAFPNPKFYRNNAIGLSNYAESRYIYLGKDENGYICIPRGLMDDIKNQCDSCGIDIFFEDKRSSGRQISVEFTGKLRDNQERAVHELLKYDCGILSAATAFGKTVTCCYIIAEKNVSTLILLESSALIDQWEKALNTFLSVNEELPEYTTRSGRIKRRKSVIGTIQGARDTSTGIIDIAMVGSLVKKGEFHPRLGDYGLVLVDECHHSASDTVRNVLSNITAKYVYGVTATPFRGDGLEKINYMLLGPVRFKYTAKEKAAEQGISHFIFPRFTSVVCPRGIDRLHINDAYELIRNNDIRNEQIAEDIRSCVSSGRTPVVLTRYTDHAAKLYERVKSFANNVFLLTGARSKKEQKQLRDEMDNVSPNESMIIVATGQLIGEGFDFPRLDTLIMATPVAWKGLVEQYAGRLNRDYDGKKNVMIYDYVDAHIPVFDRMYAKRLKAYKRIGYRIYGAGEISKQEANAIYDFETYIPIYEKDLQEAENEIVVSSPTLNRSKVYRMIQLLRERQEAGVRIMIVTWHPDAYKYGRDEHRIELMGALKDAGFHIELIEDNCEHYAVIDNEIVWYGSMNLLSKDDIEDNIMRIVSKDIAAELLEMTFHKGNSLQECML